MPEFLQPLFTLSYWFGSYPAPFAGTAYWVVVGVAVGGFVLGLVVRILGKVLVKDASTRRVLARLGTLLMTGAVLTAVSIFFTQTQTPVLGNRFWFLLWLLTALVWLVFILRYAWAVAPKERAERERLAMYQKYLPR